MAGVSGVSRRGGGNPTVPSAGTPVAGGSGVSRRGGGNPMAESRAGGLLVDCPRQLICQSAKANDHSRATVKHGTCHVEAAGRSAGHQRATGWWRAAGGGGPAVTDRQIARTPAVCMRGRGDTNTESAARGSGRGAAGTAQMPALSGGRPVQLAASWHTPPAL